ncbi:N-acetyl sugar amidotransferase [Methanococcus voltae]|uniref:N-acetyl sugar amidotransferase n=1 Tax=Methanococcus voltae TaxID=2188 RepID=A0A8J7S124_METVO|nr:N-acetyl sugar amidotransferase [Methanococcus voltae]MBP2201440.1 N-acetyl sugar amidotransferase [Methanococcus voltae]
MTKEYKMCNRCVMDTSDPDITFDENGYCNHCNKALKVLSEPPVGLPKEEKQRALNEVVERIKNDGKGKQYDCIIGVSGGVDSTYVAYLVKKLGLRPLAVHLDNGWNSELSVQNIENTLKILDIELYTYVLDWDEFKDIQKSFLKAGVPDLEIPTDHAINALLYQIAYKYDIKYILNGSNVETEQIGVHSWSNGHYDWRYIELIQKKFGKQKFRTFPHITPLKLIKWNFIKNIRRVRILDYVEYKKENVLNVLEKELTYKRYSKKHGESTYTYFIQNYILPKRFEFDKRKMHFSSLICSGQMTREEAIYELSKPLMAENEISELIEYVCDKFEITKEEFGRYMNLPVKTYFDYPSYNTHPIYRTLRELYKKIISY